MRNAMRWGVGAAVLAGAVAGCSTDVDLNAPYLRTPVVFGLLDAAADTQWVRINRTWLGPGNQFDAAAIADSSEYAPEELQVRVIERVGRIVTNTFYLSDTTRSDKQDDGVFYAPEHQAWYFVPENGLNPAAEYDLEVDVADGTEVRATTDMIASVAGNITQPPPGVIGYKMGFANIGPASVTYPDQTFKWSTTPGASRYEVTLILHVIEREWADAAHTVLVEERTRDIEWFIGAVDAASTAGGQVLMKEINGERFFTTLASRLEANPLITRQLGVWNATTGNVEAIDFILTIANEPLATYLDVNAPVTGVIQERPSYTNVVGGLGLWASRARQGVYGIGYTTDTIEHLVEGDATAGLNFCSPNPTSPYPCP